MFTTVEEPGCSGGRVNDKTRAKSETVLFAVVLI